MQLLRNIACMSSEELVSGSMASITVNVCDICADGSTPPRRYALESEGRRAVVDLCPTHSEVLEGLLAAHEMPSRRKRSTNAGESLKDLLGHITEDGRVVKG